MRAFNVLTASYGMQTRGEFGISEGAFSAYTFKRFVDEDIMFASATLLVTNTSGASSVYILDGTDRIKVETNIPVKTVLRNDIVIDTNNTFYRVDSFRKKLMPLEVRSGSAVSVKAIFLMLLLTTNNEICQFSYGGDTLNIGDILINSTFFKADIVTIGESLSHKAVLLDNGKIFSWGDNSSKCFTRL